MCAEDESPPALGRHTSPDRPLIGTTERDKVNARRYHVERLMVQI